MLETGVAEASEEPLLRRHVVVVFVDRLDMATVRALQYARTLSPDDLRAVHFDIDTKAARELEAEWGRFGLGRLPLDIIEVPDRRLGRAAIELVADATLDGDTECTVLLPRRSYARVWQRFLHDRTADKIAAVLGQVPHVSATIVPFAVAAGSASGSAPTAGRSSAPAWRARPVTVLGADRPRGPDRRRPHGAAGTGPSARRRVLAADQTPGAAGGGHHAHRLGACHASASGWRGGSSRSGSSPGRVPRTSSACSATGPAACSSSSREAEDRRDRAGRPPGGRGDGGNLGPSAGHAQPLLRAGAGGAERPGGALSRSPRVRRRGRRSNCPAGSPVANVPPGPASGATSPARRRPG